MRRSDLPAELEMADSENAEESELILNGGSAVIGPDGQYVAGPAFGSEVIILARINLERIREESLALDVTGHFNRPDIFDFRLKGQDGRKDSIHLVPAASDEEALPTATEVLLQPSTEVLLPTGTDAPPPLRVISSPRSTGFDSDYLGMEKRSGQGA